MDISTLLFPLRRSRSRFQPSTTLRLMPQTSCVFTKKKSNIRALARSRQSTVACSASCRSFALHHLAHASQRVRRSGEEVVLRKVLRPSYSMIHTLKGSRMNGARELGTSLLKRSVVATTFSSNVKRLSLEVASLDIEVEISMFS